MILLFIDSYISIGNGLIMNNLEKYIRVLMIMKKPTTAEFNTSAKITGAGALMLGLIGYMIYILMSVI